MKLTTKAIWIGGSALALSAFTLSAAHSSSAQSEQSFRAEAVSLDNFAGTLRYETSRGNNVSVRIEGGDDYTDDISISERGGVVRIDGGINLRDFHCRTRNNNVRMGPRRDMRALEHYPTLVISAPRGSALALERNAVFGTIGDVGVLSLTISSCGDLEVGNVSEAAEIDIRGSGDLVMGKVEGPLAVDIRGSGDIQMGDVSEGVAIDVRGSGDIRMGDVGGGLSVSIPGSGDLQFGRVHDTSIRVNGSGDVDIEHIDGALSVDIRGSGDVMVNGGTARGLMVDIAGSGDVTLRGTAEGAVIRENGSGDVNVRRFEAEVDWRRHGRRVNH